MLSARITITMTVVYCSHNVTDYMQSAMGYEKEDYLPLNHPKEQDTWVSCLFYLTASSIHFYSTGPNVREF